MRELLFATRNPDKVREIQGILKSRFKILSLKDLGYHREIPEEQATLEENALFKARFIRGKFGMDCFADDTGLEVVALSGQPGIYSARFAALTGELRQGEDVSLANIRKLLRLLEHETNRNARFRTIIALVRENGETLFEGTVTGKITGETRGKEGFGYDPVFLPDGQNRTFAEMSLGEKNRISHRGLAIRRVADFLLK